MLHFDKTTSKRSGYRLVQPLVVSCQYIAVAKFWCPGMVVYPLWWNDAIAGSCRLSTSHDQDSTWFGCEAEGNWFYGTTMIFG